MREAIKGRDPRFTGKDLADVQGMIREARQNPLPKAIIEDFYGEVVFIAKRGAK